MQTQGQGGGLNKGKLKFAQEDTSTSPDSPSSAAMKKATSCAVL
jgi:hypothetical protein